MENQVVPQNKMPKIWKIVKKTNLIKKGLISIKAINKDGTRLYIVVSNQEEI